MVRTDRVVTPKEIAKQEATYVQLASLGYTTRAEWEEFLRVTGSRSGWSDKDQTQDLLADALELVKEVTVGGNSLQIGEELWRPTDPTCTQWTTEQGAECTATLVGMWVKAFKKHVADEFRAMMIRKIEDKRANDAQEGT